MFFSPFGGISNIMFAIVPVIIFIGFIVVFGAIIVNSINGAKQYKRNNDSPILKVDATVVAKRGDISNFHHAGADNMHHTSSSTTYFVTFEVESGDRMEFKVSGSEYGMLVENDKGSLTFQGTRYLGFQRER